MSISKILKYGKYNAIDSLKQYEDSDGDSVENEFPEKFFGVAAYVISGLESVDFDSESQSNSNHFKEATKNSNNNDILT